MMATAMFAARRQPVHVRPASREGGSIWNPQAIFFPPRTKFKGYMRERRRSSFNKNR